MVGVERCMVFILINLTIMVGVGDGENKMMEEAS